MALHFACDGSDKKFKGKLGLLKQLLERSADIDAKEAKGNTPLLVAAGQGRPQMGHPRVKSAPGLAGKIVR